MAFGDMLDPLSVPGPNANVVPPQRPPAAMTPAMGAQPPVDPARVSGWNKFLEKLASDKNLQQTLLNSGAQLLQPRRNGQSEAGAIGGALAGGANMYNQLNTQDQERERRDLAQQQRLGLAERQTTATEFNAQTNADESAAMTEFRNRRQTFEEGQAPTQEERGLEKKKTLAEINKLNAEAKTQGVSQSIGADESLARLYAAALQEADPTLKPEQAILRGIREVKTMGKNNKTAAEFEATLMGKMGGAMAIMTPEERTTTQQKISELVTQYKAEQNPGDRVSATGEAVPPAQPINEDQTAGDVAYAKAVAKYPNADQNALIAHIKKFAPGWQPPAGGGAVVR